MRKKKIIHIAVFFLVILLTGPSLFSTAQNVTSPYSILGIGDIDTKDFGRYFSSGNASLARRDAGSYNYSNPASLTSLTFKTMNFDIAMRGRSSTFSFIDVDTPTSVTKDFIIKRISMAFKVNEKTGIAFGLRPYSSVNYKYQQDQSILDGSTSYTKSIEGNGGINQVYFSSGIALNKRLSAGITASWLFGSLQKTTNYSASSISLNITKQEAHSYYGGLFQGGLQYYSLPGKAWRHQLGITGSISTGLTGYETTEYTEDEILIKSNTETSSKFKLPLSVGIGYSAISNDRLALSIEGNYYHWSYQKVDYANSYTYPAFRFSAGMDYSFTKKLSNYSLDRGYVSWGINLENSYLRIRKNKLWDYSFSLGGGIHVTRQISVYTGLEIGKKGIKALEQIKENYTQYILGVTLKDVWLGKRFKKYD
ncbi:MAG: DUF481 domain-containing protein [Chitinophagaceae bacterium]